MELNLIYVKFTYDRWFDGITCDVGICFMSELREKIFVISITDDLNFGDL